MTINEMRQRKARLIAEARAVLNEAQTPEQRAKYDAMTADILALNGDIERAEGQERMERALEQSASAGVARQPATGQTGDEEERERRAAVDVYVRRGSRGLTAEHVRALGEGATGTGGALVPQSFIRDLTTATLAYGPILNVMHSFTTDNGVPIPLPLMNDTANMATEVAENAASANPGPAPTFSSIMSTPTEFSTGLQPVSNQLLEDAAFDVDGLLVKAFAIRFARAFTNGVTNGSSNGTNVQSLLTGVPQKTTIGTFGTIKYADLANLFAALDPSYVNNPSTCWSFNQTTYGALLAMTDSLGRPLLQSSLAVGTPDTLFGKKIVLNQFLPNLQGSTGSAGAGKTPIMFGDWSNYWVRKTKGGTRVFRADQLLIVNNQTGFIAYQRFGGTLMNAGTNPIIGMCA